MKALKVLFLAFALLWLGACSLLPVGSITSGMSREEVISRMGQPTAAVSLASGTRLQYSGQPSGQFAYMVDLDPSGRVLSVRQVLNEKEFGRIQLGRWTRSDVLNEFGPPARIERVASWPGDILTYRWYGMQDMFYWVYLDGNQVVQKAHPGVEERRRLIPDLP